MKKQIKGEKEFNQMAYAISDYIKAMGGIASVVGGVSVGQEVGSLKHNYFIQVGITGKMPAKSKAA